jgi:hypothetical protein
MVKVLLILIVVAILMEDSSSTKKTVEEIEEEKKLAEAVNATLAAEEAERKKEEEERRKRDQQEKEKKRKDDEDEKKKKKESKVKVKEDEEPRKERKDKDEALPCFNLTCPVIKPCQPREEEDCPPCRPCEKCPELDECPPCKKCGTCPPCGPCPVDNTTQINSECPSPPSCTESSGISVPVAMVIGASISLVTMGAAAVVGLILRYVPPLISGILFLSVIFVVWFLSSQYPETARELGRRAWTTLQEATVALGHRIVEAIRHHNEQVGFPDSVLFFLLPD